MRRMPPAKSTVIWSAAVACVVRAARGLREVAHDPNSRATEHREGFTEFLGVSETANVLARSEDDGVNGRIAPETFETPQQGTHGPSRGRAVHWHRDDESGNGKGRSPIAVETQRGVVAGDRVATGEAARTRKHMARPTSVPVRLAR